MASRHDKDKAVNVQVLLRCRPFSEDELRNNAPQVVTCNDLQGEVSVSQTIAGKQTDRLFTFDKVFGPSAKQKDLYDQAIVPIVNEVLEGFNCTIFAYGQTGTGKTYTMEGECRKAKSGPKGQLPADAGVIPRAVKQIFDTLEGQNAEYSVKVTFLELYNEEITDLLAPEELSKINLEEKQKKPLPLMEDGKGGVLVRGLEEEIVTSAIEIFSLLERGSSKRRTAETLLNKQSSRSHSLFTITIYIKEATPEGEELIKCGKLNLVDLAGSENISRSGAREGRAREAGEINKSLLTLGRVITALVEHFGHIPYRDSKLTRLLRDSLGGRTKTCIIATVSPSVHCLEETLSTLDYAHRAKHIKNRPEVNQMMAKSTLIKDLYGEIDRLKAEVYAAREKIGVYIPTERYYEEESERKAMAEQIEQMDALIEANQKQFQELQEKYDVEIQLSADLNKKLDATETNLDHTNKLLSSTMEDLRQAQYILEEKIFIISEQRKAENALAHQACVLRSDLEKSIRDNAKLFSKIAREDKLRTANKCVVNNFQTDLAAKIGTLCNTLIASLEQQKKHLQTAEKLCQSSLEFHDTAAAELKRKVTVAKSLFVSHIEAVQNVVRLHKADSDASLEELSSIVSANCYSIEQLLALEEGKTENILGYLESMLSKHQTEIANFTRELRERFTNSMNQTKEMSSFILGLLGQHEEETKKLQTHSVQIHETHAKSITDFQKIFEEQSKYEEQKLILDVANMLSCHIGRQRELVDVKLASLEKAALEHKEFLHEHISSRDAVTSDAKRKWEKFSQQAEHNLRDGSDFSSAEHCRMELMLQECANTIDAVSQQFKKTHGSVSDMSKKHAAEIDTHVRSSIGCNEQHENDVATVRSTAEEDATNNANEILRHFNGLIEYEHQAASGTMEALESHSACLRKLQDEHSNQATDINKHANNAFQHHYMDYEPTGETPVRSESDIPSKGTIESLRTTSTEALLKEFRENHPYETSKEPKPSTLPRSPFSQLNNIP